MITPIRNLMVLTLAAFMGMQAGKAPDDTLKYRGDINLGTITGKVYEDASGNYRIILDIPVTTPEPPPPPPPKPRPPAAPSKLTAALSPISDANSNGAAVDLGWKDNSDNEESFILQRGEMKWNDVAKLPADSTSFRDAGLTPGSYSYRVLARNEAGDSGVSNTASVTVPGLKPPPTASAPVIAPYFENNPRFTAVRDEKLQPIAHVRVNHPYSLGIPVYDADGDPLTVMIVPLLENSQLGPMRAALTFKNGKVDDNTMKTYNGGSFTFWLLRWKPTEAERSLQSLDIVASDGSQTTTETVPVSFDK